MNDLSDAHLPCFDTPTLQGHLLGVAARLNALASDGAAKELRQSAQIIVRVVQAMDAPTTRDDTPGFEAELAAIDASDAHYHALLHPDQTAATNLQQPQVRALDTLALEDYLRAHPLGGPGTQVVSAKLLSGGRCKLTARVELQHAAALPQSSIFRQDWDGGATDTTVADEFGILSLLAAEGIMVPRPFLIEANPNAVGLPFILMEHMPGRLEAGLFEPPAYAALAGQLAEQLARLHSIDPAKATAIGLAGPGDRDTQTAMLASFRADHAAFGIGSAIIDAALDWLERHANLYGDARAIIHNDLGFHNALTDGDRLTALLDWELCQIGHPAADLGYIKHFVQQMVPWPEFLAIYRRAGGWVGADAELRFHTIWNGVRLYGLIMRARAAIAAGHVRDAEISHACTDNLVLLLKFLGQELQTAFSE